MEKRVRRGRSSSRKMQEFTIENRHKFLVDSLGAEICKSQIKEGELYLSVSRKEYENIIIKREYPSDYMWFRFDPNVIMINKDHYGVPRVSLSKEIDNLSAPSTIRIEEIYGEEKIVFSCFPQKIKHESFGTSLDDYVNENVIVSIDGVYLMDTIHFDYEKLRTVKDMITDLISDSYTPLLITRTETQKEFSIGDVKFRFEEFEYKNGSWGYGGVREGASCFNDLGKKAFQKAEEFLINSGVTERKYRNMGSFVCDYATQFLADDGKAYMLQAQASNGKWYYSTRRMYNGRLHTCSPQIFNAVKCGSRSSEQFPKLPNNMFGTRLPNNGWSALTNYSDESVWKYYPGAYDYA